MMDSIDMGGPSVEAEAPPGTELEVPSRFEFPRAVDTHSILHRMKMRRPQMSRFTSQRKDFLVSRCAQLTMQSVAKVAIDSSHQNSPLRSIPGGGAELSKLKRDRASPLPDINKPLEAIGVVLRTRGKTLFTGEPRTRQELQTAKKDALRSLNDEDLAMRNTLAQKKIKTPYDSTARNFFKKAMQVVAGSGAKKKVRVRRENSPELTQTVLTPRREAVPFSLYGTNTSSNVASSQHRKRG